MRTLFLAWQDPERRRWYTVGRLDYDGDVYCFRYTEGAMKAQAVGFTPVLSFPDLRTTYRSPSLFPLFANRVLSKKRPEYPAFVEWLSLTQHEADPMALLARTSERVTDTLEVYPRPEAVDGTYRVHFFARGLRHQAEASVARVTKLEPGERLRLMPDVQNEYDGHAVALRTDETYPRDMHLVGYVPRYLASELARHDRDLVRQSVIEVKRVNPAPAPIHFRLLCRLTMAWPPGHTPFASDEHRPLAERATA
jgi:hypothetical protein